MYVWRSIPIWSAGFCLTDCTSDAVYLYEVLASVLLIVRLTQYTYMKCWRLSYWLYVWRSIPIWSAGVCLTDYVWRSIPIWSAGVCLTDCTSDAVYLYEVLARVWLTVRLTQYTYMKCWRLSYWLYVWRSIPIWSDGVCLTDCTSDAVYLYEVLASVCLTVRLTQYTYMKCWRLSYWLYVWRSIPIWSAGVCLTECTSDAVYLYEVLASVCLTVRLTQYTYMKCWRLSYWLYVWRSIPIWSAGVCLTDCTSDAVYLYEVLASVWLTVRLTQYTYLKCWLLSVWLYVWLSIPIWSAGVCLTDCTSDAVYLYEVLASVLLTVRLTQYTYLKCWRLSVWLYVWRSIPTWSAGVCLSDCTSDAVYLSEVLASVCLTVRLTQYTYMKCWRLSVWLYVWRSIPIWSAGVCLSDCTSDAVYLHEVLASVSDCTSDAVYLSEVLASVCLTVRLTQYTYMKCWRLSVWLRLTQYTYLKCWRLSVWLYVWRSIPTWSAGVCLSDCTSDAVYLYEVLASVCLTVRLTQYTYMKCWRLSVWLYVWRSIPIWSAGVCLSDCTSDAVYLSEVLASVCLTIRLTQYTYMKCWRLSVWLYVWRSIPIWSAGVCLSDCTSDAVYLHEVLASVCLTVRLTQYTYLKCWRLSVWLYVWRSIPTWSAGVCLSDCTSDAVYLYEVLARVWLTVRLTQYTYMKCWRLSYWLYVWRSIPIWSDGVCLTDCTSDAVYLYEVLASVCLTVRLTQYTYMKCWRLSYWLYVWRSIPIWSAGVCLTDCTSDAVYLYEVLASVCLTVRLTQYTYMKCWRLSVWLYVWRSIPIWSAGVCLSDCTSDAVYLHEVLASVCLTVRLTQYTYLKCWRLSVWLYVWRSIPTWSAGVCVWLYVWRSIPIWSAGVRLSDCTSDAVYLHEVLASVCLTTSDAVYLSEVLASVCLTVRLTQYTYMKCWRLSVWLYVWRSIPIWSAGVCLSDCTSDAVYLHEVLASVCLTVRLTQYTYLKCWRMSVWLYVWRSIPIWSAGVCLSDYTSDAVYLHEVLASVCLTVRLTQYTYMKCWRLSVWLYVWRSIPTWSAGVCLSDCTSDAVYLSEVLASVCLTVRLTQYTYMKCWRLSVWLYVWRSIPIWSAGACLTDCTSDAVYLYEVLASVLLTVRLTQYTYMKWWRLSYWLYVWRSIPIWSAGVCLSDCTSDAVYLHEVLASVLLTVRLTQYTYMKCWRLSYWLYVWRSIPIWSAGVCLSDCTSDAVYLYEVLASVLLTVRLTQYTYMKCWRLSYWLYVWRSIPIWSAGVCLTDCTSDAVYLSEVLASVCLTQYTYMKCWRLSYWLYVWRSIPIWSAGVCLTDCTSDAVYLSEVLASVCLTVRLTQYTYMKCWRLSVWLYVWRSIPIWSAGVCLTVRLTQYTYMKCWRLSVWLYVWRSIPIWSAGVCLSDCTSDAVYLHEVLASVCLTVRLTQYTYLKCWRLSVWLYVWRSIPTWSAGVCLSDCTSDAVYLSEVLASVCLTVRLTQYTYMKCWRLSVWLYVWRSIPIWSAGVCLSDCTSDAVYLHEVLASVCLTVRLTQYTYLKCWRLSVWLYVWRSIPIWSAGVCLSDYTSDAVYLHEVLASVCLTVRLTQYTYMKCWRLSVWLYVWRSIPTWSAGVCLSDCTSDAVYLSEVLASVCLTVRLTQYTYMKCWRLSVWLYVWRSIPTWSAGVCLTDCTSDAVYLYEVLASVCLTVRLTQYTYMKCWRLSDWLAGMRNSSMGPPWRIDLATYNTMGGHSTAELHLAHQRIAYVSQTKANNSTTSRCFNNVYLTELHNRTILPHDVFSSRC